MNAKTGAGQKPLAPNPARDSDASWSPDGRSIAFASDRDGNTEIYIMHLANPAKAIRMTNNPAVDLVPSYWQRRSR
jgi:Tol biopolymer transport system component